MLPETNIFTPKNGWLEHDPFLLGLGLFSGELCYKDLSSRKVVRIYLRGHLRGHSASLRVGIPPVFTYAWLTRVDFLTKAQR